MNKYLVNKKYRTIIKNKLNNIDIGLIDNDLLKLINRLNFKIKQNTNILKLEDKEREFLKTLLDPENKDEKIILKLL